MTNKLNQDYNFDKKEVEKYKLSDIPKFTRKNGKELKRLKQDAEASKYWEKNNRLMQLAFLRSANILKKIATDDIITGREDEYRIHAIESYIRYLQY